jgi:malonyl-CoA O-methyltransferase
MTFHLRNWWERRPSWLSRSRAEEHLAAIQDLSVNDAYRVWAPTYAVETAVSALDEELAQDLLGGLPHTWLLDAGCGIGRRIAGIENAVGIDVNPEMLAAASGLNVAVADVRQLPFAPERFDMVWCRLVLGHISDPIKAYRELSRVCSPGGYVFVTDFHPDAVAAGHRRTLTDNTGAVHGVEHYVHTNHPAIAANTGLILKAHDEGLVGESVRDFYRRGIGLKAYKRDLGLKLVDAFLFQKPLADPLPLGFSDDIRVTIA